MKTIVDYFFKPEDPKGLACCRIAFYALAFFYFFPVVTTFANLPISEFSNVPEFFKGNDDLWPWDFAFPVLSSGGLLFIGFIWKLSLFTSCIGLFSRLSMALAFILGSYHVVLPYTFSHMSHAGGLFIIFMGFMALSRAGDALSVDSYMRKDPDFAEKVKSRIALGEYTWPIRFIWLMFSVGYLGAGIFKLQNSGLHWFSPDTMAQQFLLKAYGANKLAFPVINGGGYLAQFSFLTVAMSVMTIVAECGFFLVMFSKWARAIMVPMMFFFHLGIYLFMGPDFFLWGISYVFFIPWIWFFDRPVARRAA
jgi:hypothetical protein